MLPLKLRFLRSHPLSKRVMQLSLPFLVALSLAACQVPSTATVESNVAFACKLYGMGLTYSGSKDTAETIRQIIVKNQAFLNANCDLKGGVLKK